MGKLNEGKKINGFLVIIGMVLCFGVLCLVTPQGVLAKDRDHDKANDKFDNCPDIANRDQLDSDNDGIGDVCDYPEDDMDNDGIADSVDNCPETKNPIQYDLDRDGKGVMCDKKFDQK